MMKRFLTPVILCLFAFMGLANAKQGNIDLPSLKGKESEILKPLANPAITLSVDKALVQVEPNANYTRVVTMKNTSGKAVTLRLIPNTLYSTFPTQWKLQFDKETYTLAAGATVNATMILSTNTARSVGTYFIEAVDPDNKSVSNLALTIAACKNVKYCFFMPSFLDSQSPAYDLDVYKANVNIVQSMGPSAYGTDFAAIPAIEEVATIVGSNELKVAIFSYNSYLIDQDGKTYVVVNKNLVAPYTDYATTLINSGVNVLMISDYLNDEAVNADAEAAGSVEQFLGTIGLSNKTTNTILDNSKLFLNGVTTDTVGVGISVPLSFATYKKATYGTTQDSKAKLVGYTDNKTDSAVIWRSEVNASKVVFAAINFGLNSVSKIGTRKFIDQVFNWFVGPKVILTPKISSDLTSLDFGVVPVGGFKDSSFTILSTGTDTLFVSGWNYSIAGDSSFAVVEFPTGGLKLPPGTSQTIKVKFTPKAQVKYTGNTINIINSAPGYNNYPIVFNGTGKKPLLNVPTLVLSDTAIFYGFNSTITTNKELIFKNQGSPDLVIEPLVLTENADNIFSIPTPEGFTLKGDSSKSIMFRMANLPNGEVKYYSAILTIKSNDATRPEIKMLISVNKAPIGVEDGINIEALSLNVGPNPMSDNATITYSIDAKSARNINISIVDVSGNVVALLVNGEVVPGLYSLGFDASNLASGSYFIVAKTDDLTVTKALSIVK